ncbi:hypothetical protein NL676_016086 [Syzygium grande]|nr:hypothetical protein NL676_016086 [Syzygium grande]
MLDWLKKKWKRAMASVNLLERYMEAMMALQVKTVGRVLEKTEWRATAEAASRSPARMRDWTRLWRLRRGPTRAEVESGRRGRWDRGGEGGSYRGGGRGGGFDAEAALAAAALGGGLLGGAEGEGAVLSSGS